MQAHPNSATDSKSTALLTAEQVSERILGRPLKSNTDRVAFWRAVRAFRVPHFRLGPRTIRFGESDIAEWLESKRVGGTKRRAA